MKIPSLLVAATFSVAALFTPVKKAEAGILMLNPALIVVGLAGTIGSLVPVINKENQRGLYGRVFTPIFMTFGAIAFLDQDLDKVEGTLLNEFPQIPGYIIKEASAMLVNKANLVEYNENGLKGISLTEEEFADLEAAMPAEVNQNEWEAFKDLVTSPVILN
jgi:hypothetical protein